MTTSVAPSTPGPVTRHPPAEHPLPPRPVRAELLKLGTTNLGWVMALCGLAAIVLSLVYNGVFAYVEIDRAPQLAEEGMDFLGQPFDLQAVLARHATNIFTSGQYFGLLIVMLLGILLVTNEYRHQTASSTFLATPRRERVIVAKMVAIVTVAAAAWLVTTLIDMVTGVAFFAFIGHTNSLDVWSVQRSLAMNLLAYALWAMLGVGLGALIRNQIGATVTGVLAYMVAGQVIPLVFLLLYLFVIHEPWVFQLIVLAPSQASQTMISPQPMTFPGADGTIEAPQWWVGALVLLGYGLITSTIGTLVLRRRDVS